MRRPTSLLIATALGATALATSLVTVGAGAGAAAAAAAAQPNAGLRPARVVAPPRPVTHRVTHLRKTKRLKRTKQIMPVRRRHGLSRAATVEPITWHGGAVMTAPAHLYLIWYGAWPTTGAVPLLTSLARGFGGSPYAGTNATYTDGGTGHVTTDVRYVASTTDAYTHGHKLSDAGVRTVVTSAIRAGRLPRDSSGIYIVLTSRDVKETSGFGSRYCGWHSTTTMQRSPVHYIFAGDPTTQAPSTCEPPVTTTPNGDRGADSMASTMAHEIDETLTDPNLDAWYDRYGNENADKCAWTYGAVRTTADGGSANVRFGGHDFLVQQNWTAGTHQGCALTGG